MRIAAEIVLEPVARFEVEVVGGLVEQQQPRLAQQQLGQRQAHLPAARKMLGGQLEIRRGEAKAAQDGRDAQLDRVTVADPEALLRRAVAVEQRLVGLGGDAGVGEAVFEVVHLGLEVEQRPQGIAGFGEHRTARVQQPVLGQVTDGQGARPDHLAAVGLVEPGEDPQQGGLAGPVRPAQADPIAVADVPRHVIEEHPLAETLRQGRQLDHRVAALTRPASARRWRQSRSGGSASRDSRRRRG